MSANGNPFSMFDPFGSSAPPAAAATAATSSSPSSSSSSLSRGGSSSGHGGGSSNPFDVFGASLVQLQQHLPRPSLSSSSSSSSFSSATANNGSGANDPSRSFHEGSAAVVVPPPTHRRVVPHDPKSHSSTLESNWDPWLARGGCDGGNDVDATYLVVRADGLADASAESALRWSSGRCGGMGDAAAVAGGGRTSPGPAATMSSPSSSYENGGAGVGSRMPLGGGGVGGSSSMRGMGLLKSGLRKAQRSIEQSVTTIAMRADGGKNPDQVCASLHYLACNNGRVSNGRMADAIGVASSSTTTGGGGASRGEMIADVCLSRTEWAELPSSSSSSSSSDAGGGAGGGGGGIVPFAMPLCVPDLGFLEEEEAAAAAGERGTSNENNGAGGGGGGVVRLTLRLYLRSGAALLKAVANREYCVGEGTVSYSSVVVPLRSSGRAATLVVPFASGMLAEGPAGSPSSRCCRLRVTAIPRVKFARPCTHGWTLADPTASASSWAATPRGGGMFQLPLDQGYAFVPRPPSPPRPPLFATERAVESTLVLPLAAACSRLFASAAMRSRVRAASALSTMREGTLLANDQSSSSISGGEAPPPSSSDGRTALVEIGLVALVLLPGGAHPSSSSSSRGGDLWTLDSALPLCGIGGIDVPSIKAGISFQPPHSVFEESLCVGSCPLLDYAAGAMYVDGSAGGAVAGAVGAAFSARFRPGILAAASDDLLPGVAGTRADGWHVGSIRLEAAVATAANVDTVASTVGAVNSSVEGLVELEDYLVRARMPDQRRAWGGAEGAGRVPVLVPAMDAKTGRHIGTFVLLLCVTMDNSDRAPPPPTAAGDAASPASSGLVSVVGLDTLMEESGLAPYIDYDAPTPTALSVAGPPNPGAMKRRQVATMGSFVTPRYLAHQSDVVRDRDAKAFGERYEKYSQSVLSGISSEIIVDDEAGVPLFKRHAPRPFRPSHSRGDALLTGIGFNIHVQSLSLNVVQDGQCPLQVGVTQSITHGAPADHAKGFGGEPSGKDKDGMKASEDSMPRGGLRKLESKRLELGKELDDCVTGLIGAVGDHFRSRAQATTVRQQSGISGTVRPSRHVPPNVPAVIHFRAKAIDCAQRLLSLTWDVAVRRANCFSQALGVAVTSYMASLSDGGPAWSNGGVWARHGYLITFEGLLSSVGKELGMIEDASVAIAMLRMVSVVLVPDDANSIPPPSQQRIPVPHSPFVRWVCLNYLTPLGSHSKTQYRLEIGLDPTYYQSRVPDPLKNGQAVRFFPVLFQMGVDIRQWGVNAGRSVASQIKDKPKQIGGADVSELDNAVDAGEIERGGSILDDGDDDDEGDGEVADDEILYVLNVEGYRKLNAYAHSVNPTSPGVTAASAPAPIFDSLEHQQQVQPLPVHPSLVLLGEAIKASAGKMEHSVLDRAATACQRFSGGSTVFCKSGKDRTAMQVTFKQAQFVQRFINRKDGSLLEDTPISHDEVVAKSTLMRKHGTRIPICEKNAGEPKFAFNPLQRKFMPEMLRPDASLCTWSKPET